MILGNSEFILFVGANPFEANYGPPWRAPKVTEGMVDGGLKIAVVDPRCSKTRCPGLEVAAGAAQRGGRSGLGMIRWIIENKRYDARYLANANKAAAKADNEPTWTQAAWLVKINDGKPGTFLRGSDLGLPLEKRPKKSKDDGDWEFDPFLVYTGGQAKPFDPNNENDPVEGRPAGGHRNQRHQGQECAADLRRRLPQPRVWPTGPSWPGSRSPIWWTYPGNLPAMGKRRWRISTGASPSTPRGFIML